MAYDIPTHMPFGVNFGSAPRVEYEWRTGVFRSDKGTEQRWAERQSARMSIEFEHLGLDGPEETRAIREFLERRQDEPMAIPDFRLWGHITNKQSLASGAAWWKCSRPGAIFRDQLVTLIVADIPSRRFCARVDQIRPDSSFTLVPTPPAEFGAGSLIRSCVTGLLDAELSVTRLTSSVDRIRVIATNLPGLDPIPPTAMASSVAEDPNIEGFELFPLRHNWADGFEVSYSRERSVIDYGYGRISPRSLFAVGSRTATYLHQGMGADDSNLLVDFFNRVQGRLRPFVALPSDTVIPAPTSATPSIRDGYLCHTLVIPGYEDVLQATWSRFPQSLELRLTDNRTAFMVRHIPSTASQAEAGVYRLTRLINAAGETIGTNGVPINGADILSVSIAPLWRLASDKLTLSILSDQYISAKV